MKVRGKIDATLKPFQLTLVHAWIRGRKNPGPEVLITGHLDHPKWSANDNASGSAAMMEMARSLHALIAAGKLPRSRYDAALHVGAGIFWKHGLRNQASGGARL